MFSALLVVALVGGCSRGGEEAQGPTATLGTAPTTTARVIDVGVIPADPADIDETYVQAVVDALFAVDAQATKIFVETQSLDPQAVEILDSIYTPEEVDRQVFIWEEDLSKRGGELLPGGLANQVGRVIDVAADCVYLDVLRNYSDTTTRDAPRRTIYIGLTPRIKADDPAELNPTAWMIFMDGLNADDAQPENPCADR